MLLNVKGVLLCTCLILVVQSSECSWDFWPFNRNTLTVPTIKIIPESEQNFVRLNFPFEETKTEYIDSINRFLTSYNRENRVDEASNCDFNNTPPENGVCVFDKSSLEPCSEMKQFGFSRGSPCIFFTLSQVLNWVPIVLNRSDIQQLNIPDHLNASIADAESEKYIWFTCEGDTAADKELLGTISYYPQKGFPTYYFPFTNVKGYQSPVIAVHFERTARGVVITVECTVWAKNIPLYRERGIGFAKFHLLID